MDRITERIERSHFIPVENETDSQTSRVTVEGRTITYRMTVLQQPVRARACGQGAKSSADRRPVDPPPIVELKIFEGEDQENDITFTMHANYFLFATLEQARPIAHGRVSNERSIPVLTGTPVAGMVYLDRPSPAGYFIFPDLSVRHEGSYRLSFALYEDCKSPKDEDKIDDGVKSENDAHVTHRLEVKSEPFHVFSAKKFPGLTESTSLSRMVAEQGCRVRIRRDVRMRRRENKTSGKDWDGYEDETAQARARVSATPDPSAYQPAHAQRGYAEHTARPRSASNASHTSTVSRRPSVQDLGQTYGQSTYGAAPHTPQSGYQASSYGPSPGPQYQSTFSQQQAPMQPPPPQYGAQTYPQHPPPVAASQQGYYGYAPQRSQSISSQYSTAPSASYESNSQQRPGSDYSMSSSSDYQRSSTSFALPQAQTGYSQQSGQASYQPQQSYQAPPPPPPQQQQPSQSYGSSGDMYHNKRPAPLEPIQPRSRHDSIAAPQPTRPTFDLPPISSSIIPASKLEASSPMSAVHPGSSYFGSSHSPAEPQKRSYGNVFSNRHHAEPLRQGARPSTSFGAGAQSTSLASLPIADDDDDNDNDELDPSSLGMHYRRADGRQILRALPGHG